MTFVVEASDSYLARSVEQAAEELASCSLEAYLWGFPLQTCSLASLAFAMVVDWACLGDGARREPFAGSYRRETAHLLNLVSHARKHSDAIGVTARCLGSHVYVLLLRIICCW